jgi:hypothetical protein
LVFSFIKPIFTNTLLVDVWYYGRTCPTHRVRAVKIDLNRPISHEDI